MKRNALVKVMPIAVAALLLLGGSAGMVGSGQARASLGNSGVPVRCFKPGAGLRPGGQTFLNCIAADGTAFTDGQRVPNGRYLLVTDMLVTPDAGVETSGLTDITFYDAYGTNSRQSSFRLRNNQAASFGFNFSVPYFVLHAGHRLEATSASFSAFDAEIRISGVLVTNLDFLPLTLSGR